MVNKGGESTVLNIALGSKSDQKLGYVKQVLLEINIDAKISPTDQPSGVADQPLTCEETKRGALNRARLAYHAIPGCHIGLGIEVGYQVNEKGQYEMLCWASIIDKSERHFLFRSQSFELPDYFQDILRSGKPLGRYVDDYLKEAEDVPVRYLASMIKDRKPFIVEALRGVLLRFLTDHHYS